MIGFNLLNTNNTYKFKLKNNNKKYFVFKLKYFLFDIKKKFKVIRRIKLKVTYFEIEAVFLHMINYNFFENKKPDK